MWHEICEIYSENKEDKEDKDNYDGNIVTIYHDSDRKNHEIKINVEDLLNILKEGKGVESTGKFINYNDL